MAFISNKRIKNNQIVIKPCMIALFIVVSMCAQCYYLADVEKSVLGIQFNQLASGVALIWGAWIWLKVSKLSNINFTYTAIISLFPVLAFIGAFQANALYGQGILKGIFRQHFQIIWAILYYPISKYLYYRKITVDDLKKILKIVGTIQLVVFISQYFLSDIVQFTFVGEGKRYGETRYYFSCVLLDLILFMELDNFLKNGKAMAISKKIISLVYIIAVFFEVMVVQKYRLTTIGLIVCVGLGVIFKKGTITKKIGYLLLAVCGGLLMLNTTLVQDVLSELLNGETYTGGKSTLEIRDIGRAYYIDVFLKHPICGGGYPCMDFAPAISFSGRDSKIYLSDNGFFGLLFVHGGIGIIWMVALWVKMLKSGWIIYKNKGLLTYILYPLFFLVTGINEAHWYWDDGFMILVFFLIVQQNELRNCYNISNNYCKKKYKYTEKTNRLSCNV